MVQGIAGAGGDQPEAAKVAGAGLCGTILCAAPPHETGIFRVVLTPEGGAPTVLLIHFEALLVKKDGRWLHLMEYQKGPATEAEWAAARVP